MPAQTKTAAEATVVIPQFLSETLCPSVVKTFLIDRLQFFPRLEPHSLPRRNRHLSPGPRISSNPRLPWPHGKHAKPPQLDAVTLRQSFLHAVEYSFYGGFSLSFCNSCLGYYFVNDIELDHRFSPARPQAECSRDSSTRPIKYLMLRKIAAIVNVTHGPVI